MCVHTELKRSSQKGQKSRVFLYKILNEIEQAAKVPTTALQSESLTNKKLLKYRIHDIHRNAYSF